MKMRTKEDYLKKVLLVRHGETQFNQQQLLQGQLDIPLNNVGDQQALRVADALRNQTINTIWTSPLIRAQKTAQCINQYHNQELITKTELLERNFGDYEGVPLQKLIDLEQLTRTPIEELIIPNGETIEALYSRAEIVAQRIHQHSAGTLLIVAHAGIFKALIGVLLQLPFKEWFFTPQHNTCINTFNFDDSGNIASYQLDNHEHLL